MLPRIEKPYKLYRGDQTANTTEITPVADFVVFASEDDKTQAMNQNFMIHAILAGEVDPTYDAVRLKLLYEDADITPVLELLRELEANNNSMPLENLTL